MVFGKRKPTRQYPVEEEDYDIDVGGYDDDNIIEETQGTNIRGSSSIDGQDQMPISQEVLTNSDMKPLHNEVIIEGIPTGKNVGERRYGLASIVDSERKVHILEFIITFLVVLLEKKCDIRRCAILLSNREEYERVHRMVIEAEKKGVSTSLKSSTISKQQPQKSITGAIDDMFKGMQRSDVDMKVMRGLCANGIPFNVLRNPHFNDMISAINNGPKGFKAPSYEKARTSLLDECKRSLENELTPMKDTWFTHGVSIVSDGWSNVKCDPLINIIVVNCRGAMFLYAEDFSGVAKIGELISEYILKVIDEVGPHNVLQIVTDNASNCESAGKLVEGVHKHIFWSPCEVHTLNLIFKDLARKFDWFEHTYKIGKDIVKFFFNHSRALNMFRSQSNLELLKVAKTRFASHYILLKRLIDCREALASTVVLQKWKDWVKKLEGEQQIVANAIVSDVLDDIWLVIHKIVDITRPIYLVIKFCDGDGQKMGEIYERMDNMLGEIKEVMSEKNSDDYKEIGDILHERWNK